MMLLHTDSCSTDLCFSWWTMEVFMEMLLFELLLEIIRCSSPLWTVAVLSWKRCLRTLLKDAVWIIHFFEWDFSTVELGYFITKTLFLCDSSLTYEYTEVIYKLNICGNKKTFSFWRRQRQQYLVVLAKNITILSNPRIQQV